MRRCCATVGGAGGRVGILILALAIGSNAVAQSGDDAQAPRGVMAFTYQYNEARDLISTDFVIPTSAITTHLLDLDVEYALNDRWTVSAGLPLISRKALSPVHDPLRIIPPHPESKFLDDGHFHTYWQDLRLGVRYLALADPIIVEPYLSAGIPASDYPFFANAAVGRHVKQTEIGSTVAYRPPFLRWFFNLQVGYVYATETLGVNINATRVDGEAVRFVNPRLSLKIFFSSKHGKGISPLVAPDFTSELWYYHDRMLRHNYITAGVGTDWALSDRNVLSIDLIRMVRAQDVFKLRNALSVRISRSFGSAPRPTAGRRQRDRSTTVVD